MVYWVAIIAICMLIITVCLLSITDSLFIIRRQLRK